MTQVRILLGDVRKTLATLPDNSVHCGVSSPPYFNLRLYGDDGAEIGLEATPDEYVATMVEVFREVRRVLHPAGTFWLQLGDSYASDGGTGNQGATGAVAGRAGCEERAKAAKAKNAGFNARWFGKPEWQDGKQGEASASAGAAKQVARSRERDQQVDRPLGNRLRRVPSEEGKPGEASWAIKAQLGQRESKAREAYRACGVKPKDLLLMPYRVALALQADGWFLRADIAQFKRAVMPESVEDRPTRCHETVFLLTKQPSYFYDNDGYREQAVTPAGTKAAKGSAERAAEPGVNARPPEYANYDGTRNARDVWEINPEPFPDSHYAVMPTKLVERCLLLGTSRAGYCGECGAPIRRKIERVGGPPRGDHRKASEADMRENPHGRPDGDTRPWGSDLSAVYAEHGYAQRVTVGWEMTCDHADAETVPGTVLDPFFGAGTVGLVAARMGMNAIGCELYQKNVDIATCRLHRELGTMFNTVEVVQPAPEPA